MVAECEARRGSMNVIGGLPAHSPVGTDGIKHQPYRTAERDSMPGAGFEPAKQYAEELESTPFDHSGTPASC